MPFQPFHLCAKSAGYAGSECLREHRANAISAGVTAVRGDDSQATAAKAATWLPTRILVRPLEIPTTGVGIKGPVDHGIASALRNYLHVVDQTFARAEKDDLQLVGRRHR